LVSSQSSRALDALNLFIGDVIGGIGPYAAIYLKAARHFDQASIGFVLSAMSLATILTQAPAGALIDNVRQKRFLIVVATVLMIAGSLSLTICTQFPIIVFTQIIYGMGAAIAGPAIVAVSLGLVGHQYFAKRIARNEAFNHIGNVLAALMAGITGYLIAPQWIFYLIALFGFMSILSVLAIKGEEIDHALARGEQHNSKTEIPLLTVLKDKRLVAFAIAVVLFHLANAAMLPLAGQYLAEGNAKEAPLWISACIVAAQLVMIPTSILAGKLAETWGRKPVFLIGLAVLPIRGLLYTLSNSPILIVSVQLLDGIGAGIFGVLASVIVADLTAGTGRFNATRGLIIAAQGTGAAFSNILAGSIVHKCGYNAGFTSLAAIAFAGLIICYFGLPETNQKKMGLLKLRI
jgi:MFS family permease